MKKLFDQWLVDILVSDVTVWSSSSLNILCLHLMIINQSLMSLIIDINELNLWLSRLAPDVVALEAESGSGPVWHHRAQTSQQPPQLHAVTFAPSDWPSCWSQVQEKVVSSGGGGAMRRRGGGGRATWWRAGTGEGERDCSRRWCRRWGRALETHRPSRLRREVAMTTEGYITEQLGWMGLTMVLVLNVDLVWCWCGVVMAIECHSLVGLT